MPLACALAFCVAVAAGCGDGGDGPRPRDTAVSDSPATPSAASLGERTCPDDSKLDYDSFGAPFFLTWCIGCHSSNLREGARQKAPLGIDFNSRDDIRKHKDRIWARAGDSNTSMPPAGGPSTEERARLGEWLACGAP
jgi:uncharacterized membrane protein